MHILWPELVAATPEDLLAGDKKRTDAKAKATKATDARKAATETE